MMPAKTQAELDQIISFFEVPSLIVDRAIDAGPDEKLYLLHDDEGHRFGIWARDYMSELNFEANGIEQNQHIKVAKWFPLKGANDHSNEEDWGYKYYSDGDWYAIFLVA